MPSYESILLSQNYHEARMPRTTPHASSRAGGMWCVWFAALVGWMAGMVSKPQVTEQVRLSLGLLARGLPVAAPVAEDRA